MDHCWVCERKFDRLYPSLHNGDWVNACGPCYDDINEPDLEPGPEREEPSPEEVERAYEIVQRAAAALDPPIDA